MIKFIQKYWPILIIFILVLIFAYPYWAKGLIPFPSDYLVNAFPPWQYYYGSPVKNNAMPDVVGQMFPWKNLVISLWKKGVLPLWNPYNFSGNPLLANYQSAVFHPANLLFFILPEIDAWSLMILLQPLLAGIFTYLFCRQLKLSQTASLLSAVAFMFCGFMTCWLAYGTMSWAILWLPLVLYALERIFQKISGFNLALISLSLAGSFFSGHFQTSLYVLIVVFPYLLFKLLTKQKLKIFLVCILFVVLGITLASVQIIPTFELHSNSIRSKVFGISEIIPWSYSITLLSPDFYGNPVTRNDWFGHYAEWAGFTGVIPLLLAFYAFIKRKKESSVWFFGFLALIAVFLSRPTPLLNWIVRLKIPIFSNSAAARANSFLSFSIAVLAGFGFDNFKKDLEKKKFRTIFWVCFLALIIIGGAWGVLFLKPLFEPRQLELAKRNFLLPCLIIVLFVGLSISFWIFQKLLLKQKRIIKYLKLSVFLIIFFLTVFDLFRFAQKWMPFDHRENVYPQVQTLTYLENIVGSKNKINESDRLYGFFGMEVQNYYQVQGFDGYDPLYIQRYGELLMASRNGKIDVPSTRGATLPRRSPYTERLMNLLGAKYFLHAIKDEQFCWEFNFWDYPGQFEKIYQDEKYEIYENKKALPRAFMAYDYKVIKEPQKIIDQLLDSKTDLRKLIILEEEPSEFIRNKSPKEVPQVEFLIYQPNQIEIRVQTQTSGLLFLSDNAYPGWKALVDGVESKIYRADYAFRAIEIPAGNHQVKFVYQPDSFKVGIILSGFSSLSILTIILYLKFKK